MLTSKPNAPGIRIRQTIALKHHPSAAEIRRSSTQDLLIKVLMRLNYAAKVDEFTR